MPLGPARVVLQKIKVSAPAGTDYSTFGTLVYEARNAAGLTIPFTATGIPMTASGSLAIIATWTDATVTNYYAAGSGANSTSIAGACLLNLTTGALRARVGDGTTLIQPASSAGQIVNGAQLACLMSWAAGGNVIVRAKASQISSSIAALGSLGTSDFKGGTSGGAAAGSQLAAAGFLYHMLVYSTVVDLAALQTALNADWGL